MKNERFYCVGCKQHYELEVHAAQKQASKGGSFRHSLISECPKGHRVNKLCKKEVYEEHSSFAAEEGSAPVQDPMEFGEMANWTPLDGTPSLKKRKRAEGMTVGVNLEALEPTPDEPENGESMVPADSLMPEGSGHVIGSQSTSHNYTPFHAEVEMIECGNCDKTFTIDEGLDIGGIDYCEGCYDTRSSKEVHSAETFIVYPELYEYLMMQDLLRSDKTSTKHLQDDDYEITVPSYLMDDILAAVSEYQSTEKSDSNDSDFAFGQSKTTVAVTAAGLAVFGAWLWNKNRK